MKVTEMKITMVGDKQLYIPLSKKLEHDFKQGEIVIVQVMYNGTIMVTKKAPIIRDG